MSVDVARTVMHYLTQDGLPGVALLEPLRFGANHIVTQVETYLPKSLNQTIIVRLVPRPNTNDEKRLYSALYRDLHSGLQKELGQPLPEDWEQCFAPSSALRLQQLEKKINELENRWKRSSENLTKLEQRYLAETQVYEQLHLKNLLDETRRQQKQNETQLQETETEWEQIARQPADEEAFEVLLTNLLEGPVSQHDRVLVLMVEGLSRVAQNYLQNWAWLMSRLTNQFALKLLVWGGQELHHLCTGTTTVEDTSPFQRLKQIRLGNLSAQELSILIAERVGSAEHNADILYDLTHGHPALVYELLDNAVDEVRDSNRSQLKARLLAAEHLKRLQQYIKNNSAILAVVQRLLAGDSKRRHTQAEDDLYWWGIIEEKDAGHWRWRAPVFPDWLQSIAAQP